MHIMQKNNSYTPEQVTLDISIPLITSIQPTQTTSQTSTPTPTPTSGSGGTTPTSTPTQAPTSCTAAPAITSPSDGATTDRGISINWNAAATCASNGYTVRINQTADPEDRTNMPVDHGIGGTSDSFTFPNDGTWYIHVRTAGSTPGPWTTIRIVVQQGYSNGFQVLLNLPAVMSVDLMHYCIMT